MKALYNRGIPIDSKLMEGYTGLTIACQAGALQCSAWLLHKGASPLIPLQSGKTALELSAANSSFEQFRLMIEHTKEIVDLNRLNSRGETLLHIAAAGGNLGHTTILIQNCVHLNEIDNNGLAPLHAAAAAGHKDIVRILLACGANDTIRSSSGKLAKDFVKPADILTKEVFDLFTHLEPIQEETLLHRSVRSESLLATRLLTQLLSLNEINQHNINGFSALHIAVQMRQKAMITSLIQAGADIDAVDVKGCTPLWIACLDLADPILVQLLIGAGANPHHVDFSGNVLIQQTKQPELLHILQDAKCPE
jgi:ankyrin repeat protein